MVRTQIPTERDYPQAAEKQSTFREPVNVGARPRRRQPVSPKTLLGSKIQPRRKLTLKDFSFIGRDDQTLTSASIVDEDMTMRSRRSTTSDFLRHIRSISADGQRRRLPSAVNSHARRDKCRPRNDIHAQLHLVGINGIDPKEIGLAQALNFHATTQKLLTVHWITDIEHDIAV